MFTSLHCSIFYFTATKPEKHILLRILSSVTAKWHEIGDLLGVDPNTIEGLCHSNYSDQVKMSKMLQSWLDNEPTPATWGNIINVIEGPLRNKSVANEMYRFVNRSVAQLSDHMIFNYWL